MAALVKMRRDDGHEVDVHPEMVADYRKGGYVALPVEDKPAPKPRPVKKAAK